MRLRPVTTVLAAGLLCGHCAEEPDPPRSARDPFPGVNSNWRLVNFGTPRVNRGPLPQGTIGGYTRQLILTSPVRGQMRLSGKLWVRIGRNSDELRSPSRADYNAFGITCDLESREQQQQRRPSFGQTCTDSNQSNAWIAGCDWPLSLEQGQNEVELHCIVRGNGERSAFTVGVLELRVCTEHHECDTVDVDPNVRYQAGADIPRPNGLVIFEMNP